MKKVVHISKTPLVAAPSRIANALNQYTDWEGLHFYEHDYPGALSKVFISDSCKVDLDDDRSMLVFASHIFEADVIHIHNMISKELALWLRKNRNSVKYVYHIHSPQREGPVFLDKWVDLGIEFDSFLVVAQFHPRMYQRFRPVPNIVPWDAVEEIPESDENELVILYSPAHRRQGRWNTKVSPQLDDALEVVSKMDGVRVIGLNKPMMPRDLFLLRKVANITIDEIATGGFHMVSLEGLMCGNMVINGADEITLSSFRGCAGTTDRPPFKYSDPSQIIEELPRLVQNRDEVYQYQRESLRYARQALGADKLVKRYTDVYEQIS